MKQVCKYCHKTILVLALSSCSKITIKDARWCGDAGDLGAFCFWTLSDKQQEITKPDWDKARFGMVCTEAANFADWKAATLKLCRETKMCSYEVIKTVTDLEAKAQKSTQRPK